MINLIPAHARKQVKIEYWVRVVSVWLLLLTFAVVITAALMVPSLALIRSQLLASGGMYQSVSERNDVYTHLETEVSSANTIAQKLVSLDNETLFSNLIAELQGLMGVHVQIQSISFARTEGKIESITISGDASSRAALVQFRDSIESHRFFDSAELPLSNLAKDKDVPFSITIVTSNALYQ